MSRQHFTDTVFKLGTDCGLETIFNCIYIKQERHNALAKPDSIKQVLLQQYRTSLTFDLAFAPRLNSTHGVKSSLIVFHLPSSERRPAEIPFCSVLLV